MHKLTEECSKIYQQALDGFLKVGAIEIGKIACVIKWPSTSSVLTLFKGTWLKTMNKVFTPRCFDHIYQIHLHDPLILYNKIACP